MMRNCLMQAMVVAALALVLFSSGPARDCRAQETNDSQAAKSETAAEPREMPDLIDLLPDDFPNAPPSGPAPPAQPAPEPTDEPNEAPARSDATERAPSSPRPGRLPWEEEPAAPIDPALRPPNSPKEILERFGVGPSQLEGFFSGQAWTPSEEDTLIKILYRFPRFGLGNVHRWRKTDVTLDQLAAAPQEHRGEIIPLRGRVTRVEKHMLVSEIADLYEYDHYFEVTMQLDNPAYVARLFARQVPPVWPLGAPIDEPAGANGLFLKVGDVAEENPPLLFAAHRIAWYPDEPSAAEHIGRDQLKLTAMGLDWGLMEQVRAGNGKPIGDGDREAFYQLLDIVGRPGAEQLSAAAQPLNLVPLLSKAEEHIGDLVTVRGTARRIIKVAVDDHDIRARFGIDHYYEIDMFLPLGETSIRLGKDATGEENPVYYNTFPATLIARTLPPGLEEGESQYEQIEAPAIFFKIWMYRSKYTDQFQKFQPAPMFIASEPRLAQEIGPATALLDFIVGGVLVLVALSLIGAFWWAQRSNRSRGSSSVARGLAAGLNKDENPDFSGLK